MYKVGNRTRLTIREMKNQPLRKKIILGKDERIIGKILKRRFKVDTAMIGCRTKRRSLENLFAIPLSLVLSFDKILQLLLFSFALRAFHRTIPHAISWAIQESLADLSVAIELSIERAEIQLKLSQYSIVFLPSTFTLSNFPIRECSVRREKTGALQRILRGLKQKIS